ncbi:energy transducer TonB [Occallatibacter riparius]|uniref:Energy transducer TonB n=1 Tax=Occallatibacter riparius TaxID=1002689 RepID=A0A9J7BV23_9BACT|nr:energy transducer TonB [Occallatibacter riparius]UWZ86511.1 energy transducer TonB [Occallatibacter riparius]
MGIDVLGADLGFGMPVVAFQIDGTGDHAHRKYQIYSLTKPARLLNTITGADSYEAADSDLDGQIEIWTDDAAALDGFEGVPLRSFDFAPTVVLRFEKKRLVDVSPEFSSYYDAQIAGLRGQLDPQDLAAFKSSDGALSMNISRSGDERHQLARTKIKVLEIVWAYLYSGRDSEAWSALQDMWPPQDLNRIRVALSDVRGRGILRGIDRASKATKHNRQVHVYDATGSSGATSHAVLNPNGGAPETSDYEPIVVQPKSILLRRPPPDEVEQLGASDAALELLVDSAGKVRSAKLLNGTDKRWIQASAGWHFIPALRDGKPVACRFRLSVWNLK